MDTEPKNDPAGFGRGRRPKHRRARAHPGTASEATPVVRLDIYASSEGAEARPSPPPLESRSHEAELRQREVELERTTVDLASRAAKLEAAAREIEARARLLDEREQVVAKREARAESVGAAELDAADVERRRRRLAAQEAALAERANEARRLEQELEERERDLAEREARVRVELDFKEDELENRERAVAELEHRLERKASELTAYVGQLQGRLSVVRPS